MVVVGGDGSAWWVVSGDGGGGWWWQCMVGGDCGSDGGGEWWCWWWVVMAVVSGDGGCGWWVVMVSINGSGSWWVVSSDGNLGGGWWLWLVVVVTGYYNDDLFNSSLMKNLLKCVVDAGRILPTRTWSSWWMKGMHWSLQGLLYVLVIAWHWSVYGFPGTKPTLGRRAPDLSVSALKIQCRILPVLFAGLIVFSFRF